MSTPNRRIRLLVVLLLAALLGVSATEPRAQLGTGAVATPEGTAPLLWLKDLDHALAVAEANLKPVFAVFTAPRCTWCERLRQTSLQDATVQRLLRQFVLALVDVSEDPRTAAAWNVSGVPHMLVLSARGRPLASAVGYRQAADVEMLLAQALTPAAYSRATPRTDEVVRLLQAADMPTERWPEVMLALGEDRARDRILPAVLARQPLPVPELTKLLDDPRLAVRLGAIEMLEELTGTNYGFDPWRSADNHESNRQAIARFQAHNTPEAVREIFFAFDETQFASYVQDLLSNNRQRARRAARMLQRGGVNTIQALYDYLAAHPELPHSSRTTIRELQYAIYLNSHSNDDGESWAHRLVAGNPDARLQAIAALRRLGAKAPPILKDFLDDPSALVREAAVEVLAQTGAARQVVPLFVQHLETERDREVIYRILAECRRLRTKASLNLLLAWIDSEHEDLAIVAIQSIGKLRTPHAEDPLLPGLSDPRWRVRLATLDTMRALGYRNHIERMQAMLKDPDEFIRHKAVEAVAEVVGKDAMATLEKVFIADDALKPAIISAWWRLEAPLSPTMLAGLEGKPPQVLIGVLGAIAPPADDDFGLDGSRHFGASSSAARVRFNSMIEFVRTCAEHSDLDVAAAALRILAKAAIEDADARRIIHRVLESGRLELVRPVLHSLNLRLNADEKRAMNREAATAPSSKLGAFLHHFGFGEARPAPALPKLSTDGILSGFGFDSSQEVPAATTGPDIVRRQIEDLLVDFLRNHSDAGIRDLALDHLLSCGRPEALIEVQERLATVASARRLRYAGDLAEFEGEQVIELLRMLLRDPATQVRKAAAAACLVRTEHEPQLAMLVLEELTRPDALLQPREAYVRGFEDLHKSNAGPQSWARTVLEPDQTHAWPLQHYALLVAAVLGSRELLPAIEPFVKDPDPIMRRAAWHALGRLDSKGALTRVDEVLGDPSKLVREVVLSMAGSTTGPHGWLTYFDANTAERARPPWAYRSRRVSGSLDPAWRQALETLTEDPVVPLRARAFFALLENRIPIDLTRLAATLEQIPDAATADELVGTFFEQNLDYLGPPFRLLLPYVKSKRDSSQWFAKKLAEKFPESAEEDGDDPEPIADLTLASRPATVATGPQIAGLLSLDAPFAAEVGSGALEDRPVTLLFFTTGGCTDCERAKQLLPAMQGLFKGLVVHVHDVRTVRSMLLNEALCERFAVPMQQRLTAPAVFTRAGFLLRQEITAHALAAVLARASAVDTGDDAWYRLDETVQGQADARITGRHAVIRVSAIIAAGLLDGVNPCAFATIIFLLSYLQVTRRTPRQIVRIGGGFIAGVFATYYLLGMGLIEVVTRLEVLRRFGQWLNYALVAFASVIAVLSVRDGVLCLRGRMADMSLQLPLVLKRQIHASIRTGSRQTHVMLAAFTVGALVSVLELACTGQVYAPTILYMLKTGRESGRALGLLLVYNLAFIAPLCVVFLLASRGLTSERLRRALERHAALVKFATAALFLLLIVFLLFGHHFMTQMTGTNAPM